MESHSEEDRDSETQFNSTDLVNIFLCALRLLRRNFASVILLFGLCIAYFEYQASQSKIRIERTFDLIKDWDSGGYRKKFIDFSELIMTFEKSAKNLSKSIPEKDRLLFEQNYVRNKLTDFTYKDKSTLNDLFYFFDKAALCSISELCDTGLVNDFFGVSMKSFRLYSGVYIAERREITPNFSNYLDNFIKANKQ